VDRKKIVDVRKIARIYSEKLIAFGRERAERKHLAPLGLDLASFVKKQRSMHESFISDIVDRVRGESPNVEVIIAGFDSGGPHIYYVSDDGETCQDDAGFCAIGTGVDLFEGYFSLAGYDRFWPLHKTMMLTYEAKRKAEAAPGVGPITDLLFI